MKMTRAEQIRQMSCKENEQRVKEDMRNGICPVCESGMYTVDSMGFAWCECCGQDLGQVDYKEVR